MRFDIFVVLTSVFAAAAALVSPVPVSASHAADLGTRTSEAPGNLGEVPRRGGKPVLVLVSPPCSSLTLSTASRSLKRRSAPTISTSTLWVPDSRGNGRYAVIAIQYSLNL
ncbi:hypothetical protein CPB85DRAFT_1318605 [Mucidula mucida]|nr:hypothetical protein CPB85DRAFT_1318605 [Mucidula mucida]